MQLALSQQQQEHQATFRAFVEREIVPHADQYDQQEFVPREAIARMAEQGYLGAILPASVGGMGLDMVTFGLLHEEVGRGCSSLRSLLTVHSMVSQTIARWGSRAQRDTWLSRLARGEAIGAFALSEPNVGSDAGSVETTAESCSEGFVLRGQKRWITFGQIADLFLVFARCGDRPTAFLVERDTPGLEIQPLHDMLGTRASMLAALHLKDCVVPRENIIGGIGFGIAAIATSALNLGRFSVACGCVGIGQACLDASSRYTAERKQFGAYLKEHQLIRQMITDMVTNVKAARLLCFQAGYLSDAGDPSATTETFIAKYFASTMATKAARDTVQIHGAFGCSPDSPAQRYLRDATVMEIIEGSTQIQQITIAEGAYSGSTRGWAGSQAPQPLRAAGG